MVRKLKKSKTGITGFDEITDGGLPEGRTTLICGGPGCGKTLFSIQFLVKGATLYNEPGVFMAFEEKANELEENVASLGFDLEKLQKQGLLKIDHVHIDRHEIEETGQYDLEGLFIRLNHAIKSIGAKRVVLDTIENLFAGLQNEGILRAELRRLFQWLKEQNVTAIVTGEKGEGQLTRHGLEEYVSDCVVFLDHRVIKQISTRRLRIIKYRGSIHGTNEYPFLIDNDGLSVLPITSVKLERKVSSSRISTGIQALDKLLGGKGFYRESSIMVSGTAGTGKTSIAALFAAATCKRGEKCMFFAFEESPSQIMRNMKSISLNLEPWVRKGLLKFNSTRPAMYGLEMHLAHMYKLVKEFKPRAVIIDPITNLISVGEASEVSSMLVRVIDFLQSEGITVLVTALMDGAHEQTEEGISSLVDTWIAVRDVEMDGERNRTLYIMKSRGMKHSNQVREFIMSDKGVVLEEIYLGPRGVLIGSARKVEQMKKLTGSDLDDSIKRQSFARVRQGNGKYKR